MQVSIRNFVFIESADVNFSNGLTLVKGINKSSSGNTSNGSGKTLFLEAIIWGIWGISIRGAVQGSLVGPHDSRMSVTVSLPECVITRSRTEGGKVDVTVRVGGETEKFQRASQAQERINELVGIDAVKAKLFVYYGEHSDHILDMSSSERRDAVVSLVDYHEDTHNELHAKIGERLKAVPIEVAKAEGAYETAQKVREATLNVILEDLNAKIQEENQAMAASNQAELSSVKLDDSVYDLAKRDTTEEEGNILSLEENLDKQRDDRTALAQRLSETKHGRQQLVLQIGEEANKAAQASSLGTSPEIVEQQAKLAEASAELSKKNLKKGEKEAELRDLQHAQKISTSRVSELEALLKQNEKARAKADASHHAATCDLCNQELVSEESIQKVAKHREKLQAEFAFIQEELEKTRRELEERALPLLNVENELGELKEEVKRCEASSGELEATLKVLQAEEAEMAKVRYKEAYNAAQAELYEKHKDTEYSRANIEKLELAVAAADRAILDISNEIKQAKSRIQSIVSARQEVERARTLNQKAEDLAAENRTRLKLLRESIEKLEAQVLSVAEANEKELETIREESEAAVSALYKEETALKNIRTLLGQYKHHTVTRFVQAFELRLNTHLENIDSDIRCKVEESDGEIEFLFSDSSKDGEYYPYKVASRGERTRIKKIFFQSLVEMFNPPFVLSDESYDGLDEQGMLALSSFTLSQNSDRYFIEASPIDLEMGDHEANLITVEKTDLIIRVFN